MKEFRGPGPFDLCHRWQPSSSPFFHIGVTGLSHSRKRRTNHMDAGLTDTECFVDQGQGSIPTLPSKHTWYLHPGEEPADTWIFSD
jgi:hypothetical protein